MSQASIRAVLRASPDGMTATELHKAMDMSPWYCKHAIKSMPDVYIDRWVKTTRSGTKYHPVYVAVDVPSDTPMPN